MISRERRRALLRQNDAEIQRVRTAAQASAKRGARAAVQSVGAPVSIAAEEARLLPLPPWLSEADGSHQLRYIGGVILCEKCGSTGAAALDRSHRLRFSCRGSYPAGSAGRTRALLAGRLIGQYPVWPDLLAEPTDRRHVLRLAHTNGSFGFV